MATQLEHGGLAIRAVSQHLDLIGHSDHAEADHHHHLVDDVPPGHPLATNHVSVDDSTACIFVERPWPRVLDDELDPIVVDLEVAMLALGAHASDQGGVRLHDAGSHLAGIESLSDVR